MGKVFTREVKWVDDVNRMRAICTRIEGRTVKVIGPIYVWTVKCREGETPEALRQLIAERLAGKGIGKETEDILNTL
jgi:hypothetical protein